MKTYAGRREGHPAVIVAVDGDEGGVEELMSNDADGLAATFEDYRL